MMEYDPLDTPSTLFDEYKQAVQDVLDGNVKEPPRPSVFPDEQDMLAALYAAAAALFLSKEAPGGGGGVLVVGTTIDEGSKTVTLDKTWQEIVDSDLAVLKKQTSITTIEILSGYGTSEGTYWVHFGGPDGDLPDFNASSASGYPSATIHG